MENLQNLNGQINTNSTAPLMVQNTLTSLTQKSKSPVSMQQMPDTFNKSLTEEKKPLNKALIAKISAASGGGILALGLGIGYAVKRNKFDVLLDYMQKNVKKIDAKENTTKFDNLKSKVFSKASNAIRKTFKATSNVVNSAIKVSCNSSQGKDVATKAALDSVGKKVTFINKFIEKTTRFFSNSAINTAEKKYLKAQQDWNEAKELLNEVFLNEIKKDHAIVVTNKGHKKKMHLKDSERHTVIENYIKSIDEKMEALSKNFKEKRLSEINKELEDISEEFKGYYKEKGQGIMEKDGFKQKINEAGKVGIEHTQSIKADDVIKELKRRHKRALFNQKDEISRSTYDNQTKQVSPPPGLRCSAASIHATLKHSFPSPQSRT